MACSGDKPHHCENIFPFIQLEFTMLHLVTVYFFPFAVLVLIVRGRFQPSQCLLEGNTSGLQAILDTSDCVGDTFVNRY